MIGYVMLGTNNLEKSAEFYDALFADTGIDRLGESEDSVFWSQGDGSPFFCVTRPYDKQAASVGNGTMIAFPQDSAAAVDSFYAKAIKLGATDAGAPGPRGGGYYCAYIRDLDGNKLNFYQVEQ